MTKKTLIEFPCNFPVKIIGTHSDVIIDEIKDIVLKHFPEFDLKQFNHKLSDKQNYLSITVTVIAQNQDMLDAFYMELTKHPHVKMVL